MNKTATIAAVVALCAAGTVNAQQTPDWDRIDSPEYGAARICYAHSDNDRGLVAVLDTWVHADYHTEINVGTLSGPAPLSCIPTDCPDGYFLASGNNCSTVDPFAHIGFENDTYVAAGDPYTVPCKPACSDDPEPAAVAVPPASVVTLDVGPLIEPSIASIMQGAAS